jgi:hypothetical protein
VLATCRHRHDQRQGEFTAKRNPGQQAHERGHHKHQPKLEPIVVNTTLDHIRKADPVALHGWPVAGTRWTSAGRSKRR